MKLQDLNYDCLDNIFRLLPLQEQLVLALFTHDFKTNIGSLLIRKYARNGKLTCADNIEKIDIENNKEGIAEFVSVLCGHIEELTITNATVLSLVATQKWPKLRLLNATVDFNAELQELQFRDEHFPVLEKLDLMCFIRNTEYPYIIGNRSREQHSFRQLCRDIYQLHCLLECIQECKRWQNASNVELDHLRTTLRELSRYRDTMKIIATNYLWMRNFKVLKGNKMENPQVLKVGSFNTQVLRDLKQERLHYPNYFFETIVRQVTFLSEFLTFLQDCMLKFRERTRSLPLQDYCFRRPDPRFGIAYYMENKLVLRATEQLLPNDGEHFDIVRYSFKLKCEWH